ncbi:glycosyltransferase [Synechococcus sp. MIT S1220]|uniref:glycosyltransferase n=1 Tax=Synechococcus sp. MIT S1220 TaxID=3082549 RepID=UPI0039AF839A
MIPLVLHQIGADKSISRHLEGFRRSWKIWNPDLEVIYWSDATLRQFIAQHVPTFLPLFDSYSKGVCRADLGRYLLLQYFGGIYADLDCQCLRPLAPLLEDRELLIATEPAIHHLQKNVILRGLKRVICPSFIASIPGHPFWSDVLLSLTKYPPSSIKTTDDVLDATGPFLLSRVLVALPKYKQYLVPEGLINPFSKADCWQGLVFDPIFWLERSSGAYVAHYWDGSWFRSSRGWQAFVPSQAPVSLQEPEGPITIPGVVKRNTGDQTDLPLISCLMVVTEVSLLATLAVECFLEQSYPNKELILVDASCDDQLESKVRLLNSGLIRYVLIESKSVMLSSLNDIAFDCALGGYICQWNSDDLHDPLRLEMQWKVMQSTDAQASVLARRMTWWPGEHTLSISSYLDEYQSVMCERSLFPRCSAVHSDAPCNIVNLMNNTVRIAKIDLPRLCIHINFNSVSFSCDLSKSSDIQSYTCLWTNCDCERLLNELDRRIPLLRCLFFENKAPLNVCNTIDVPKKDPKILILTPVRNAQEYLSRYESLLQSLTFDSRRLSFAWLEGDSTDQTFPVLEQLRVSLSNKFNRISLHRFNHYPSCSNAERWSRVLQRDRRERLARVRNQLLMMALEDEDWVLWLDVDVCDYPSDLLERLLAAGRDIVTANCLNAFDQPFDLNSYRLQRESPQADTLPEEYMFDGLYQPPIGFARNYVNDFRDQSLIELDSVGATVLLIRADLHRQGLNFPPYPMNSLIETEALSLMARNLGVRSWALPQLIVRHD